MLFLTINSAYKVVKHIKKYIQKRKEESAVQRDLFNLDVTVLDERERKNLLRFIMLKKYPMFIKYKE